MCSAALVLLTSWDKEKNDTTIQPTCTLIEHLKEETLQTDGDTLFHCTTLEVEVSEEQKKDAKSVGATLVLATRNKWSDPLEDPPGVHWLFNHWVYFPELKGLQNIEHVVGYSPKTHNAAAAIHESLFPKAKLHQLQLPNPLPVAALLVTTSYQTESEGQLTLPTRTIVSQLREESLNSNKVSEFYCTTLEDEVSEDQREDAEQAGVTLIPPTRTKWSHPAEDPPGVNWLINHGIYYPQLKKLQNIKHVVGFLKKTQYAAMAIHEGLFPEATLHQLHLPDPPPGVLFVYDEWNREDCGLTGFHRILVRDFSARKREEGKPVKAYSTLVGVKVSDDQKADATSCDVTLIAAQRQGRIDPDEDEPELKWLLYHKIYYPDLQKLENIQYVVGYAPKTGLAAADIREKVFPSAELVMINHAYEDDNCLLGSSKEKFSEMMLKLASEADIIFSIGPSVYEDFRSQYRATYDDRELHIIPHAEILPKPAQVFFKMNPKLLDKVTTHSILTYGQIDTQEALDRCETIAASTGRAANVLNDVNDKLLKWSIQGVSRQASQAELKRLLHQINSDHVKAHLVPAYSAKTLQRSLCQSDICLPPPFSADYGFSGLESIAVGLPTYSDEYSQLGKMVKEYFPYHADRFVVSHSSDKISEKIIWSVKNTRLAFEEAKELKKAFMESEDVNKSYATFASMLKLKHTSEDEDGLDQCRKETTDHLADTIQIHVRLDENAYQQHLAENEDQNEERRQAASTAWKNCQREFNRRAADVVSNRDDINKVKKACTDKLGRVDIPETKTGCLQITVAIPRLSNLYRLRGSCHESRSLARALEPILMTDAMGEANTAGIPLQLTATYDQTRFDELELVFLNRDGGGIGPVKVCDDTGDESIDEILDEAEGEGLTLQGDPHGELIDLKQGGTLSKLLFLEIDPTREIKKSADKYAPVILNSEPCKTKRKKGRQRDIIQLSVKMTKKVQHILSHRPHVLELLGVRRYLMTDTAGIDFSDSELEEKIKQQGTPVHPLQDESISLQAQSLLPFEVSPKQFKEIQALLSQILCMKQRLDKVVAEKARIYTEKTKIQLEKSKLQTEKMIVENQLKEAIQEKTFLEKQYNDSKQKLASAEKVAAKQLMNIHFLRKSLDEIDPKIIHVLESKLQQKEQIINELNRKLSSISDSELKLELEDPTLETEQEKEMSTTHPEMQEEETGTEETKQPQPETTGEKETGDVKTKPTQPEHHEPQTEETEKEDKAAPGLFGKLRRWFAGSEETAGDSVTPVSGEESKDTKGTSVSATAGKTDVVPDNWSMKVLDVQSPKPGKKFIQPRGMVFHGDRLVVCDMDNHSVQILNQDYSSADRVLSFDGRFANPCQPLDVAVSHDSIYFINDKGNSQIVVCDQNSVIIRIITLSADINAWGIALLKGYVLITEVNGQRLLKYTKDGQYVAEVGGQGYGQTQFDWPGFVVVNSKNVILVSDRFNHCIKCFDQELKFLYQFGMEGSGPSRLWNPLSIDVDEEDNVYVCDWGSGRVVKWRFDGEWVCQLFYGELRNPSYLAVMSSDQIAVRESGSNQIKMFYKHT